MRASTRAILLLVGIGLTSASSTFAVTDPSPNHAKPDRDCTGGNVFYVPNQYATIQLAIDAACTGDTILVSDGDYAADSATGWILPADRPLVLKSAGGPLVTFLRGNGAGRVLIVNGSVVDGFTITDGNPPDWMNGGPSWGGGMQIVGKSIIRNCRIIGNQADFGGGLHISGDTTRFVNCEIAGNAAVAAMGISGLGIGGAVYLDNGTVIFDSCNIHDNAAAEHDGVFVLGDSRVQLTNCVVKNHDVALFVESALDVVIEKSTLFKSGLIGYDSTTDLTLSQVLLFACNAQGIFNPLGITCTNIFGNGGEEWTDALQPFEGTNGNVSANPLFCADSTTVRSTSPCLPANNSCGALIGAGNEGCLNQPPAVTSADSVTATEYQFFVYRATALDDDGPSLSFSFIDHPSWLAADADSIFGAPIHGNKDTGFVVIASDGFLADTQFVKVSIRETVPQVAILAVEGEPANQHVVPHAPGFSWTYFDPTGTSPQTRFEIAVGSDNEWTYAELWNPAPFESSDTSVVYAGSFLQDGQTYFVRLRVYNGMLWSQWFSSSFRMNTPPTIPSLMRPLNLTITSGRPTLWIANSSDVEGDDLQYDFAGFHDTDCVAGPAIELTDITPGADSTGVGIIETLAENCRYWWRARAFDGYEYSDWSPYAHFLVNDVNEPPSAVNLFVPSDTTGKPVFNMLARFTWGRAYDPDPMDTVCYTLAIALTPTFSFASTYSDLLDTSFVITDSLFFGTKFYWRVTALDKSAAGTPSATQTFWTWRLGDINHDHQTDVGDMTLLIDNLFISFGPIEPRLTADMTGDCRVDVSDLTEMIGHLFITFGPLRPGCE